MASSCSAQDGQVQDYCRGPKLGGSGRGTRLADWEYSPLEQSRSRITVDKLFGSTFRMMVQWEPSLWLYIFWAFVILLQHNSLDRRHLVVRPSLELFCHLLEPNPPAIPNTRLTLFRKRGLCLRKNR
jgi:hypothetical protein